MDLFWDECTFPDYKEKYLLHLKYAHRNILFFQYMVVITMFAYSLASIFQKDQLITTWLPFNRKYLENNLFILITTNLCEAITIFYTIWFCLVPFDCLFYFFIVSAILQLRLLGHAFKNLMGLKMKRGNLSFKDLVIHHVRIYKYTFI